MANAMRFQYAGDPGSGGVGRSTFRASLDSPKRRSLMVCVGTSSGTIPPFDPQLLARKTAASPIFVIQRKPPCE